jgi:hypothetical protein
MVRVVSFRNYGVFVLCERGGRHHRPHGHIKHRGMRIASVYLETLTVFDEVEPVPSDLLDEIARQQELLLDRWEELNSDD